MEIVCGAHTCFICGPNCLFEAVIIASKASAAKQYNHNTDAEAEL
jgi:hypothetical protein